MKLLSTFSYLLLVPQLAWLGLDSNARKETARPAGSHIVQVRVIGQNLDDLGAELSVRSVLDWDQGHNPGPEFTKILGDKVNETYTVGTFGRMDYVEASISFKKVIFDNKPPSNAHLRVEIITDGKVGEVTRLDANAVNDRVWKVEYDPYMKGTVAVETNKL
ncbi:MAG TPA: hypothetical protein VF598_09565 [Hymenobacter sp.]